MLPERGKGYHLFPTAVPKISHRTSLEVCFLSKSSETRSTGAGFAANLIGFFSFASD